MMRLTTVAGAARAFSGESRMPPRWRVRAAPALRLLSMLRRRYRAGGSDTVVVGFVPGRVEVLGRHTDYAGGRSLVCAIDRGFLFAAVPGRGRTVRMSEDSAEFDQTAFELSPALRPQQGHWTSYPMTMARRLAANFRGTAGSALRGADIAFSSTLPVGSGMSGSSALMMTLFSALAEVNGLWMDPAFRANISDPVDLAGYLACAENGQCFRALAGDGGVGTFGGSEDHAAILCGRSGWLSLFRFCPMSAQEEIRWPSGWRLALAFSGVRAEKTREALEKYNMASRRARTAVERYNGRFGTRFSSLGDAVRAGARSGDWRELDDGPVPGLADRVRQFVMEDRRFIPRALAALRTGQMDAFGKALSASHRASARYLWNIAPEVDTLQSAALSLGARGASGFGAGFGGSIMALVGTPQSGAFLRQWRARYLEHCPERAAETAFFSAVPGPGIELWSAEGPRRLVDRVFS